MQRPLILSLFPGIDLLGRAFEEEWAEACVVRGPDLIFGGDIRNFHPPHGVWAGCIGGPPCQTFSRMRHLNPKAGEKHGNLIPEFERCVDEARPDWFVMENVPEAPEPKVDPRIYAVTSRLLNNRWLGEEQNRLRRFTFGSVNFDAVNRFNFDAEQVALESPRFAHAVCASGGLREVPIKIGGSGKVEASRRVRASDAKTEKSFAEALRLQGLPADFLSDAPFTVAGKIRVVGNGVPMATGRAVAQSPPFHRRLQVQRFDGPDRTPWPWRPNPTGFHRRPLGPGEFTATLAELEYRLGNSWWRTTLRARIADGDREEAKERRLQRGRRLLLHWWAIGLRREAVR